MLGGNNNFQEKCTKELVSLFDSLFFFNSFKKSLNVKELKQKEANKIKSYKINYAGFGGIEKKFIDYFVNNLKVFKDLETELIEKDLILKLVTIINIFGLNKYEINSYYKELKEIKNKEFPKFFPVFIKQISSADKDIINKKDLAIVQEFRKKYDFKSDYFSDKYILKLLRDEKMDFEKAFIKHSVIQCANSD